MIEDEGGLDRMREDKIINVRKKEGGRTKERSRERHREEERVEERGGEMMRE